MHWTLKDREFLLVYLAAMVARERKAQGIKLNYPEAFAFVSAAIADEARKGKSVSEIMDLGTRWLRASDVMEGVPEMIPEVQVEATFPDGCKLVTVHHPIRS